MSSYAGGSAEPKAAENAGSAAKAANAAASATAGGVSGASAARSARTPAASPEAAPAGTAPPAAANASKPEPAGRLASATDGKTDAQLAKEADKRLYLLLPSRAHMDTVKRLCNAYPGDVPVYVKLQDEGIALLLSRDSWCAAGSDMLTACRELYGEGGVVVR
jgi:hypothetical protein